MYEFAQDLFAITVASLAAASVLVYRFWGGRTVVYVDISGSMSSPEMMDQARAAVMGLRVRNAVLKAFDHDVREIGPFSKRLAQLFFDRRPQGGGSDIEKVIADFRASGAKRAIVITDDEFFTPETDMSGMSFVKIKY